MGNLLSFTGKIDRVMYRQYIDTHHFLCNVIDIMDKLPVFKLSKGSFLVHF